MTIPFEVLKAKALSDPEIGAEYNAIDVLEFEASSTSMKARLHAGLSRAELESQIETSRSSIAELKNCQTLRGIDAKISILGIQKA